jgi:hypothetical protein
MFAPACSVNAHAGEVSLVGFQVETRVLLMKLINKERDGLLEKGDKQEGNEWIDALGTVNPLISRAYVTST